ncbi:MAG: DUF1624 domain-containing protein [Deltaproteobacteria bacterium]|nr:DUF1624 domain-containing protein [Deltaproteobacteria bacterium]
MAGADDGGIMTTPERDRDIDFGRGLACLLMAAGHIGFHLGIPVHRPPSWPWIVISVETSVALFFMASGMNVLHFVRRNEGKRGWGPTRTFATTAVALAIFGLAYNVNRQSLGFMDLFQGIAAATFLTYIPFRRNWPTWSILTIALLLFGVSFGHTIVNTPSATTGHIVISAEEFTKSMRPGYPHGDLMARYLTLLADLRALPWWERVLFIHFSVLPWTAYALIGGVIVRLSRTRYEAVLWMIFAGSLALSFLFPQIVERHMVD